MSDVNFSNDVSELINVSNISISFTQYVKGLNQRELKVITDLTLDIKEGEIVAVLGSSGSGKSLLAHAILGILPSNANLSGTMMYKGEVLTEELKQKLRGDEIALIPQSVNFLDPLMKVSDQVIGECVDEEEEKDRALMHNELEKVRKHLYEIFHLEQLLDKHIILLSSGELRKFQLTKMLMTNPRVLIMDNPFIGLDVTARAQLAEFLTLLTKETNVSVVLVLSKTDDIPDFITHVVPVKDLKVGQKMTLQAYLESREPVPARMLSEEKEKAILELGVRSEELKVPNSTVIEFRHVNIRYGERTILKDLNLTVKEG